MLGKDLPRGPDCASPEALPWLHGLAFWSGRANVYRDLPPSELLQQPTLGTGQFYPFLFPCFVPTPFISLNFLYPFFLLVLSSSQLSRAGCGCQVQAVLQPA